MTNDLLINIYRDRGNKLPLNLSMDAIEFHQSLKNYKMTSLINLRSASKTTGVKSVYIKDESERFGLNSFKALGPYYAIFKYVAKRWNEMFSVPLTVKLLNWDFIIRRVGQLNFTAASEGNHGKALAWAANQINQGCLIYLPDTVSLDRLQAIKQMGAQIQIVKGTYEQTMKRCFIDAVVNNRTIISDMSYQDYRQVPVWIMESYLTIFIETQKQLLANDVQYPDFVFVQAGVGGLAAAAAYFYGQNAFKKTKVICVEPEESNCIMESVKRGKIAKTKATMNTIMGCLNCDYPSYMALPTIFENMYAFLTISDDEAKTAMRTLYHNDKNDPQIISGESGSASFAGFQKVINDPIMKKELGIDSNSVILCINTEGNNDPVSFEQIINQN